METVISTAITAAMPLLLAALAVLVASRSGVLNLAVEGIMLGSAFLAAWVAASTGGGLGFAVAVISGVVWGVVLGWVMVTLRADQVVVGVAFNIMLLGLTSYAASVITHTSRNALNAGQPSSLVIPLLHKIPWVGVVFEQNWIGYLAFALVPVTSYLVFRTGAGTRLRACGEHAEGARAVGIDVIRTRLIAMAISGALAGAAGAYIVLADLGLFRRNITDGRGYIGFVIVILARYRPVASLVAAVGFGLVQALTFYLQLKGVHIPSQFILATPYIATLLAIVLLGRRIGRPPAEEGRPLHMSR